MTKKRYRIELTESQLRLVARCVEDCHRFMCGQMELSNTISCLKNRKELRQRLADLQPLVTPELTMGANWDWSGCGCPDKWQRQFIAQTYYLYREIYHRLTEEEAKEKDVDWNVYLSETLTCEDSGEPIKVDVLK